MPLWGASKFGSDRLLQKQFGNYNTIICIIPYLLQAGYSSWRYISYQAMKSIYRPAVIKCRLPNDEEQLPLVIICDMAIVTAAIFNCNCLLR